MNNYTIIKATDLKKYLSSYVGDVANQRLSNDKLLSVVRLNKDIDGHKSYTLNEISVEMLKDNWITNDLTLE